VTGAYRLSAIGTSAIGTSGVRRGLRPIVVLALALAALPASAQPIAITGGKVHPVSGPPIENATVVITDGKITAVGRDAAIPPGARVIDAKGKWITPGLFNATTALGLVEVGMESSTNDNRAEGERGVAAAFRAWDALNPASPLWAPARNEGVTTVGALPAGGLIAGQGAVVDTFGSAAAEMVRRGPAVMVVSIASVGAAKTKARGELFQRLREVLEDARVYAAKKATLGRVALRALAAPAADLAALQPVLDGKLVMLIAADRATDIEAALAVARDFKLRIAILGGAEAWMVAPQLATAKVPVFTTALDSIPTSFASLGTRQENAALLRKAGVPVVLIVGAGETFNVRNIRQQAGNAVAYGLPWDEALRAVTLAPAEALGVADAIGSIAAGKDANVVVWDGDPFEFATRAEHVFIRGREVQGPSRQDLLTEKYLPRRP
jgi:imidazolonepropionase-like amidohydrolase